MANAAILKVNDINVFYGAIHAIKGVSFEVGEGEIVTLIGANGAGKTTTLQTVSGLLRSKTGSIEFMGQGIDRVPPTGWWRAAWPSCRRGGASSSR